MSDVQLLFVVLAVLYGAECLCWLRRGGVAFTTWLGRSWKLHHPGALAGNESGGFILATLFPPLGALLVANQFPLSLSAEGALAFVATNPNPGGRPSQSGRFVSWNELSKVRVRGKKVLVNDERLLTAATPGLARYLGSELKRLAALKSGERAAAISQLVKTLLDPQAIEALRADWQRRSRPIRWLANLVILHIFVIAPALIWHFGFPLVWLWLLLGLLVLTGTTATLFARAHSALYPEAHEERFTHTLTIALAPTSTMRAQDALSRPLLEKFHPLAVAQVLLGGSAFREFARPVLLDLRHPAWPACPNELPEAQASERFFRQTLLAAAEKFLTRHGVKSEELCRAPRADDELLRAYCPRCEAQFTSVEGHCADCGGLTLVAFNSPQS